MIFRSMDEVIDDSSASSPPSFVSSATSTSDFFLHKITLQQAYRKKKQPVLSKPKRFISHDHGVEDAGSSTTTDKGAVNIVDSAAAASVEVQLQNDQQQQRQQHQQKKNISSVNIAATAMSGGSSCCDASLLSVKVKVLETLVSNVFTSIASLRSAYGLIQSTISIAGSSPAAAADHHHHHHLESASFSSANRSIVAELARLTRLQHSYLERNAIVSGGSSSDGIRIDEDGRSTVGMVSPSEKALLKSYEGVIENLHAEVRKKKAEVESLKDWLAKSTLVREKLEKKVRRLEEDEKARALKEESVGVGVGVGGGYNKMEMEAEIRGAVERAAEACRSFTKLLMSLMRAADLGLWDIIDLDGEGEWGNWRIPEQQKQQQQRRRRRLYLYSEAARKQKSSREEEEAEAEEEEEWALESYVSRRMWRGFESADFYVEDAISSEVIEAAAAAAEAGGGGGWEEGYRRRCREEYERMKVVEAAELVGGGGGDRRRKFGKFCLTKFGEIMNAKIERRILGNSEHSEQIRQGSHPNSKVYQSFLGLAKGVWLVHRLAFSFFPSPPPSIFQARPSMPFSPLFMQPFPSSSPPSPPPYFVAFPITPGFLISSRIIVKCKVRLLPRLPTST